jgi:hypothetical protein
MHLEAHERKHPRYFKLILLERTGVALVPEMVGLVDQRIDLYVSTIGQLGKKL